MRATLLIAFGCSMVACTDPGTDTGFPGPIEPNPGGPGTITCKTSSDCSTGQECTRDDECLDPSLVRSVLVHWTVQGMPASDTACQPVNADGALQIIYSALASGEENGFSPLMCSEGQFFVDLWPARFDHVRVSAGSMHVFQGETALPDGDADVTVDLQPL